MKISEERFKANFGETLTQHVKSGLYRCICCDHEFAIYSPIIKKKSGEFRTQLSKSFVIGNNESKLFKYEIYNDDFWVMVDEEQRKADSKI